MQREYVVRCGMSLTQCPGQFTANGTICPILTGEDVLDRYSIQLSVWANVGILAGLILFFRMIAYFALLLFAKRHKAVA